MIFDKDSYPHPYHKKEGYSAKDIWEKDKRKIELANINGYDVLTIWDSEYRKHPQQTLDKCIEFLNKK
jgi:very-short-patch-repair endonuclease